MLSSFYFTSISIILTFTSSQTIETQSQLQYAKRVTEPFQDSLRGFLGDDRKPSLADIRAGVSE